MYKDLVLAGDIGGTKCHLAFFRASSKPPEVVVERTYQSGEFPSLQAVVRRFFNDTGLTAATACFGVAGAVEAGKSDLPNLGWRLSERELSLQLGLGHVVLINDLEATALGLDTLSPDQFFHINPGLVRPQSNRALIAAGTGLGMAILPRQGLGPPVLASEGGHADFAPRNADEIGLFRFLQARYGHVSVERVVSGPGLVNIFDYLRHSGMFEADGLSTLLSDTADPAAGIARLGLEGEAAICVKALDMFISAYGAVAGNLALLALATGGVYIGGGIAPKLLRKLSSGDFIAAFTDKGRFTALLGTVPVRIILEPATALLGAGSLALDPGFRMSQP